jgi:hypothetical protein
MADLMSYSRANEVGPLGMYHLSVKPPTHRFHENPIDTLKQFVQRIRETPMHPQVPFIPEGMSAGPSTHSLYTPTMSSTAPSSAQIHTRNDPAKCTIDVFPSVFARQGERYATADECAQSNCPGLCGVIDTINGERDIEAQGRGR